MNQRRFLASAILSVFVPVALVASALSGVRPAEAQTACFTTTFNQVNVTRQRPFVTGIFAGSTFKSGDGISFKNNNGGPLLAASGLVAGDVVTTLTIGTMYIYSDNSYPFGPNGSENANLLYEMVGQWTNDANQVIGDGFDIDASTSNVVPAGATRLYVAFTDTDYFDNHGSYTLGAKATHCTTAASSSRSSMVSSASSVSSSSSSAPSGFASIDVKINGQDGFVNAPAGSLVTVSWTSNGVQRCDTANGESPWGPYRSVPVSGSENVVVTKSMTFPIECAQTPTSPMIVMDVVAVNATSGGTSSFSSAVSSSVSSSSSSSVSIPSSNSSALSSSVTSASVSSASSLSSFAANTGCIQVYKQAYDVNGNQMPVVPQFSFFLDGSAQVGYNGANGRLRFDNVPAGLHTVTEGVPGGWLQLLVTPDNGNVNVVSGKCSGVVFINKLTFSSSASSSSNSSVSSPVSSVSSSSVSSSVSSASSATSSSSIVSSTSSASSVSSSMSSVSTMSSASSASIASSLSSSAISSVTSSAASSSVSSTSAASSSSVSSAVSSSSASSTSSVNLSIAKTDNRATANQGDRITYTISISNATLTDATGVTVTDDLPPQVSFVSASNGGTLNASRVTWTGLTVPANSTLFITVTVDVSGSASGTLTNIATVNNGNSATDSTTVNAPPQTFLQLTKFASYQQVGSSRTIDYTVTVRNAGSNNANAVIVTDTMGSNVTVTSNGGGTQTGNQLQWTVGTLLPNETRTFQYRVSVNSGVSAGTVISNTVKASGSNAAEVQVTLNLTLVSQSGAVQFAQSRLPGGMDYLWSIASVNKAPLIARQIPEKHFFVMLLDLFSMRA